MYLGDTIWTNDSTESFEDNVKSKDSMSQVNARSGSNGPLVSQLDRFVNMRQVHALSNVLIAGKVRGERDARPRIWLERCGCSKQRRLRNVTRSRGGSTGAGEREQRAK